jgi:hypothetical protein
MAEGQNQNPNTPSSQDSGHAGDGSTALIFGKYKSIEEAEKAHKELERKFHEGNERYVQLDSRLQQLETRGYGDGGDEGYGRGQTYAPAATQPDPDNAQLLTRLYADPKGTLGEIEERATQKAIQRISQHTQKTADYQQRIAGWTAQNQDVAAYGDLLTFYVGQTDARLTPETRLDQAAERVRKRVLELKGAPQQQEPNPANFVDGATSAHGAPARQQVASNSNESQLKGYVSSRNSSTRKPLQHGAASK